MSYIVEKLRERVRENYIEMMAEMLSFSKEYVFDNAMSIAAANEVLFYIENCDCINRDAAIYFLDFTNPLEMIAEAWEEYMEDGESQFPLVLASIMENEDNEENYMTMVDEREECERHAAGYAGSIVV